MKEVVFRPVGVVHTDASSESIKSRVAVNSMVEVFPEFEPAAGGTGSALSHLCAGVFP